MKNIIESVRGILCQPCRSELAKTEQKLTEATAKIDDLADQLPPDKPSVSTTTVDYDFIKDAVSDIEGFDERSLHRQMNAEYKVLSREDFQKIEEHDGTETRKYVRDHYDCVDFTGTFRFNISRRYRINSVGTVITSKGSPHAFNVVVFDDGTAELFEPQSGKFAIPESSDLYRMEDAIWMI